MTPSTGALATRYDVALLDLDGVVYRGRQAVPDAVPSLLRARELGLRLLFVTNNASRTPVAIAQQLCDLGLPAVPGDVVTSAQAAARLVVDRLGPAATVLPTGGDGLRIALREAGCQLVQGADDHPRAVVQGWSPELCYGQLAEAALAVRQGAWWVATNRDLTLPTERGIQPGNGAMVGAVAAAVGRGPDAFAGKPDEALTAEAIRRAGAKRPLAIGDRLDTDVEGAQRAGIDSLCVMTGVATAGDLVEAPMRWRPTYLASDLRALLEPAPVVVGDGRTFRAGAAVVTIEGGTVTILAVGDGDDLLRAVVAARWAAADRGESVVNAAVGPGVGEGVLARWADLGLPPLGPEWSRAVVESG